MGVDHVIDRRAEDFNFWSDDTTQDESEWRRFGKTGARFHRRGSPHCLRTPWPVDDGGVGLHRAPGGTIVTCAATSGYMIEYDNRHLWMKLKRIVSSHFANYHEAWEMNRLIDMGRIHPTLSKTFALEDVGEAAYQVHTNQHEGKAAACSAWHRRLGPALPIPRNANV